MVKDLIQCINVHRHFHGAEKVSVLRGIDFSVKKGDTVSIEGASGSGKSTLLLLLAGLDNPNKGQLFLFGQIMEEIAALDMLRIRNSLIGVVYQHHHLLPEFSIVENVAMPLLIRGVEKREAIKRAGVCSVALIWLIDTIIGPPSFLVGNVKGRLLRVH